MTKKKFEIQIDESQFEDKNTLLGSVIRLSREMIKKLDVPGELTEFGDETPLSSSDIRSLFDINKDRFSYHMRRFCEYSQNNYNVEIKPLINEESGATYSRSVVRMFLAYMNRKKIKYNIEI